jgi:crotonobetainyl-CoA:carnitine CoA-transferase CaiB-like acyl-CoA transferase
MTATWPPRSTSGPGPLAGIRVADFSRVLAGPLATMTLGDLGADVVKVERPGGGDETRAWAPPYAPDGTSTYYLAVNRNKRSVALDLSTVDGRTAARELALGADVLVENFAPGTMERFGLGYEELSARRPELVYASVTGFGRAGGARLPGYDFLIQAVGGLMSVTGAADGPASKVGVALVDVLAGQNLVAGVLAALYARQRTGRGQRVDVDLLGSLLFALVNQASAYLNAGTVPERMGNRHPSIAPYETLATADRPIAVAVGNDGQFARLAAVLAGAGGAAEDPAGAADDPGGAADDPGGAAPGSAAADGGLAADPRFADNPARVRNRAELVRRLEGVLSGRPAAYWIERLGAAGVPCGPVNRVDEAFELAERLGLEPVVRLPTGTGAGATVASVASPLRLSGTPVSYRAAPPPAPG